MSLKSKINFWTFVRTFGPSVRYFVKTNLSVFDVNESNDSVWNKLNLSVSVEGTEVLGSLIDNEIYTRDFAK